MSLHNDILLTILTNLRNDICLLCIVAQRCVDRYNIIQERGDIMGKASTKAQNKYINKKYDRINLTVEKGKKEIIKDHAESMGESVNGFINRAINETMERDKGG